MSKVELPSRIKKEQPKQYNEGHIIGYAHQWAELHAKPKTREKMDELIADLPEPIARKVVLCGQRIAAGLPPKIAP